MHFPQRREMVDQQKALFKFRGKSAQRLKNGGEVASGGRGEFWDRHAKRIMGMIWKGEGGIRIRFGPLTSESFTEMGTGKPT